MKTEEETSTSAVKTMSQDIIDYCLKYFILKDTNNFFRGVIVLTILIAIFFLLFLFIIVSVFKVSKSTVKQKEKSVVETKLISNEKTVSSNHNQRSSKQVARKTKSDDVLSNPLHPSNPLNPIYYPVESERESTYHREETSHQSSYDDDSYRSSSFGDSSSYDSSSSSSYDSGSSSSFD